MRRMREVMPKTYAKMTKHVKNIPQCHFGNEYKAWFSLLAPL